MTNEILMHFNEELSEEQKRELLLSLGNQEHGLHAAHQAKTPHMIFVAYDPEELCPHDLVAMAAESGVHAQVIDL